MSPVDVSPLMPEARRIVEAAAAVYLRHTSPWFVGLIVHGSALKGGSIPGSSDIDLKLYLEDAAFIRSGQLPLQVCLSIQRDLSLIDPSPFRYIQCDPLSMRTLPDEVGPVPGAYHVVAGRVPVPEASSEQLRQAARDALTRLDPLPAFVTGALVEHGGGRLSAAVRLLCTRVWPALYNVLALQRQDVTAVWRLPKDHAIALVPDDGELGQALRRFHRAVLDYYPAEASVEGALAVVEHGIAVLQAAVNWHADAGKSR